MQYKLLFFEIKVLNPFAPIFDRYFPDSFHFHFLDSYCFDLILFFIPIPSPSKDNVQRVFVSHTPPEKYPSFPYRGLVTINERPSYVIGRSMSESEPISSDWVEKCNNKVDEVTNYYFYYL